MILFYGFGRLVQLVSSHTIYKGAVHFGSKEEFSKKILRSSLVNVLVPILQVKHVFSTGHRNLVHRVFFHRAITFMLQNCLCSQ